MFKKARLPSVHVETGKILQVAGSEYIKSHSPNLVNYDPVKYNNSDEPQTKSTFLCSDHLMVNKQKQART